MDRMLLSLALLCAVASSAAADPSSRDDCNPQAMECRTTEKPTLRDALWFTIKHQNGSCQSFCASDASRYLLDVEDLLHIHVDETVLRSFLRGSAEGFELDRLIKLAADVQKNLEVKGSPSPFEVYSVLKESSVTMPKEKGKLLAWPRDVAARLPALDAALNHLDEALKELPAEKAPTSCDAACQAKALSRALPAEIKRIEALAQASFVFHLSARLDGGSGTGASVHLESYDSGQPGKFQFSDTKSPLLSYLSTPSSSATPAPAPLTGTRVITPTSDPLSPIVNLSEALGELRKISAMIQSQLVACGGRFKSWLTSPTSAPGVGKLSEGLLKDFTQLRALASASNASAYEAFRDTFVETYAESSSSECLSVSSPIATTDLKTQLSCYVAVLARLKQASLRMDLSATSGAPVVTEAQVRDPIRDTWVDLRTVAVSSNQALAIEGTLSINAGTGAQCNGPTQVADANVYVPISTLGWSGNFGADVIFFKPNGNYPSIAWTAAPAVSYLWRYRPYTYESAWDRLLSVLNPGIGFNFTLMDIEAARQATSGTTLKVGNELGAGVTVTLFQGLVLGGVGYDFGANGNPVYYFFGISLTDVYNKVVQTVNGFKSTSP